MRFTLLASFSTQLAMFALILGAQALPQWLQGLRRDLAYAPAAYNPVYHPRDGSGYSYKGYGPQPTAVSNPSSTSSSSSVTSDLKAIPSKDFLPSGSLLPPTTSKAKLDTSFDNTIGLSTSYSTPISNKSTFLTSTTAPETSQSHSTAVEVKRPPVCNHDNCLRAFLRTSAATPFCVTYITVGSTTAAGLPLFVSHCSGLSSRISSACSCLPILTSSVPILSTNTPSSNDGPFFTPPSSSIVSLEISASSTVAFEVSSTTIMHLTLTSPATIYHTPSTPPGTISSIITASPSDTSAPFALSNQTSLKGPTSTKSSSIRRDTSVHSSTSPLKFSFMSTLRNVNSSIAASSHALLSLSGPTSAVAGTGFSYRTIATTAASNSSHRGITSYRHSHYYTGGSRTTVQTGFPTNSAASGAFPLPSSDGGLYLPFTNSSSLGKVASTTASGFNTAPSIRNLGSSSSLSSSGPYYSAGNSSATVGSTGSSLTSHTILDPTISSPMYPIMTSVSVLRPTGTYLQSSSLSSASNSSTSVNCPITATSTPYYSIGNATSTIESTWSGSSPPYTSSVALIVNSASKSSVRMNSSSLYSQSRLSRPTLRSGTPIIASITGNSYISGKLSVPTGENSSLYSPISSFGPFSNSTSTTSSNTSAPVDINLTVPVHALPTHHEGYHKKHHYKSDQYEDEGGD